MDRLYQLVSGWDAGHQLALFLGAWVVAGLVLLFVVVSVGHTLRVLRHGWPPERPMLRVFDSPPPAWQSSPLPTPRRPARPGQLCPATLRLFDPEEPA